MRVVLQGLMMGACIVAASALAQGQGVAANASAKPDPAVLVRQATTQMASPDEAARREAGRTMRLLLENEPTVALPQVRGWVKAAMDAKLYDEAEALAVRGILAAPQDTATLEALQLARVKALQAAGKPQEALVQARGLFNVCSMATTKDALLLLTECLNAAHPGDLQIAERFKAQQIAGATVSAGPGTAPSTRRSLGEPILLAIKLDGPVFEDAAKRIYAEDYASLMGKGNLLLLANKPADAKAVFERAYAVAPDTSLAAATENLARCMKAEDGAIGRANHFLAGLRAPAPAAPVAPARGTPTKRQGG